MRDEDERKVTEAREELRNARLRLEYINDYFEDLPHTTIEDDFDSLAREQTSLQEGLPKLEEKIDRLRSLKYGKDSVELTTINIAVAVGVPIAILFITLLGTIVFEAFKPEILDWIRHLFGLRSLPK
jgi:hypothetical protein